MKGWNYRLTQIHRTLKLQVLNNRYNKATAFRITDQNK